MTNSGVCLTKKEVLIWQLRGCLICDKERSVADYSVDFWIVAEEAGESPERSLLAWFV